MTPTFRKHESTALTNPLLQQQARRGKKMENAIPTDSVLRRHYEATHGQGNNQNKQNNPSQSGGGVMCWLKKLFGS